MTVELLVVGGGKMGEALLGGLLAGGWTSDRIAVVEPVDARRDELAADHGVAVHAEPVAADGVILAVKPHLVATVAAASTAAGARRFLSIAAGVTLAEIEAAAPDRPVVRAMPNTPALVGLGAAAVAGGSHADADDLTWAADLLGAVGDVVTVDEAALDAVTGLSGSGPAYVFLLAEALTEAGVLQGLARPVAERLAAQTIRGAGEMLVGDRPAPLLRADVTSPGGTTAAGLAELERGGLRAAVLDAVSAAADRSRRLGAG